MNKKQILILLIPSVILGLFSAFMVRSYIIEQRTIAIEDAKLHAKTVLNDQAQILIARRNIPKGSSIDIKSVTTRFVPRKEIEPRAVSIIPKNMVAMADIVKSEQITLDKIGSRYEPQRRQSLSSTVPIGKRAMTIEVDNISALEGMIKPNDYVDILATVAVPAKTADGKDTYEAAVIPLFQNVLVLAVGQETERDAAASLINPLVTLALTPQEATVVAFLQVQGKISLVLRSPRDEQAAKADSVSPANIASFLTGLPQGPSEAEQREAARKAEEEEDSYTVEIYRGVSKQKQKVSQ